MSDLVMGMRIALDEVEHDDLNDIFTDNSDEEMKQAIETAAQQLLLTAPAQMLLPQRVMTSLNVNGVQDYDAIQTQFADGHGCLVIPDDWLRLVALRLKSWPGTLTGLMDPDSKEAQMQASRWTRGTPQKPRGMITNSPVTGKRVLMYWTAGRYDANHAEATGRVYDHEVELFTYIQFLFYRQWDALKKYINGLGIRVIGDIPVYVAMDSADVWAEPGMFQLDGDNRPVEVSGVPPDYFSADGQLWGNPLYDYEAMARDGFGWWIRRIGGAARLYDVIRIDHFRGWASYWAVPYGDTTAKNGRWVKGPGMALVGTLTGWFPELAFIAEDLGSPSPEVTQLLADSGLPGMKVLEFAFDPQGTSSYLPHCCGEDCVYYTGTHDNAPLALWRTEAPAAEIGFASEYLGLNEREGFVRGMLRGGMSAPTKLFIAQMQDYLELGEGCRTNTPGTDGGNWTWRMLPGEANESLAAQIRRMTQLYGRI